MSYKTNAKTLRLGITHDWNFKAHGPLENFHFDEKLKQYVVNMIEHVVPQAPKNAKTKGKYLRKFAVCPGTQGKTIVLRSSNEVHLIIFFYLNYDGAEPRQIKKFHRNFSNIL